MVWGDQNISKVQTDFINWIREEVAVLHLMVFRLVQIQAMAMATARPSRKPSEAAVNFQATAEFDNGDAQDPVRAQRIFDAVTFSTALT